MKKILALVLAMVMVLCAASALADGIKVGIINLDPSESGYRQANVADLNASRLFEANPATQGEYMLTTTLAAGDQLQVVQVVSDAITNWFPGGESNNYAVDANHNGSKTIYFRPDRQGGQDWHMGCMYIAANETNINNVGGEAKAVKLIQNGKVIIRVNGENYTVLGQKVEK